MSKLFEALTKGQDAKAGNSLEALLEGQIDHSPPPPRPSAVLSKTAPADTAGPSVREPLHGARVVPLRVSFRSPILPFDGSHWRAGEQYRILRTKIVHHIRAPRVIAVTSAGPYDGKSVTAVNLAGALALKSEARVLLIDGDFRRSSISVQLGLPQDPGLAEILTSERLFTEALLQAQQIPNLYILPAGKVSINPAELLDSSRWKDLMAYGRENFKYVVIDSPPIGAVADYDLIQQTSDGAVLVVRPDHTNRQRCFNALGRIPKDKLLGVVLNCVEEWFRGKEQHDGSYYYHPAASANIMPEPGAPASKERAQKGRN